MRKRVLALTVLAVALACGCGHNREPNAPVVLSIDRTRPYLGFEAALSAMRLNGYQIEEIDTYRFYIRARAKVDAGGYSYSWGKAKSTTSYFHVLAYADGSVSIAADGHLVGNDGRTINRKLQVEMHRLAEAVRQEAARMMVQGPPPPDYRPNAAPEAPAPPPPTMPIAAPLPPVYSPPPPVYSPPRR